MLSNGQPTVASQLNRIIEILTLNNTSGTQAADQARSLELLLELRALHDQDAPGVERIVIGAMSIDLASHEVWLGKERVHLTHREFALLSFLARHRGRVCTREQIVAAVWGDRSLTSNRTVDIHVYRLRNKLTPHTDLLDTVRNVGYILRTSSDLVAAAE